MIAGRARAGRLRWLALAALACLLPAGVSAQEEVAAPITAQALPKVALPGAAVRVSGETPKLPPGTRIAVTLRIDTTPDQEGGEIDEPLTRDVALDDQGRWRLDLKDEATAAPGRYTVEVTAPDGKGQASTTFDIVDGDAMDELVDSYTAEMNKSLDLTEAALIAQLSELALGLPAGPEKDGVVTSVNKIVQKLREGRRHRPPPLPPLPPPPAPGEPSWPPLDYAPVLEAYRDITAESDKTRKQLLKSQAKTDNCLRMDSLVETLNLASSLTNFIGGKVDVVVNLLSDKILPAVIERNMAPKTQSDKNETAATIAGMKLSIAALKGIKGVIAGYPGIFLDAINHRTKAFSEVYCTRYEGAFTATIKVDHYTAEDGDTLYWSYTTRIGGLVSLTEPKPGKGEVEGRDSLLRGRFDGAAIGYDTYQDALKLNPKLRPMLVYQQLIAPPKTIPLPPVEMGAVFNALVSPVGFQVPITAERSGDKVVVNLGEALRDMDPRINRGLLVQVFQAGPIPAPNYQVFPMQDAHFILSRGMRKDAVLNRVATLEGRNLEGRFHREETPAGLRVVWDVQIEMCSPACSQTTIDRLKPWYDAAMAKRAAAKK